MYVNGPIPPKLGKKTTFGPVTRPLLFFSLGHVFAFRPLERLSRRRSRFPQKAIRAVVPTAAFVARETREMPKERGRSRRWLFPPPPRPPRCRGDPCTGRSQSRSWGKKVSNFFFHQRNNCGFPIKNALASESGLVQQRRSGWWGGKYFILVFVADELGHRL